ncbi:MAG: DNA mismatch repair protein MutS, partial [Schleiferiaceae bacterium]|nr:DNA mismatch repair protein MutS [Schleiferiaceae bacterium]
MAKTKKVTPLMVQFNAMKAEHPEALLLFRVGDFYETFGQDAVKASKTLDIVLTKRSNGAAADLELAGFPYHALDTYLPKLVRGGHKVAICEQLEDPKGVKGIVKRGVTEVITPGIAHHEGLLSARSNNYLACIHLDGKQAGLALMDVSTGEFHVAEGSLADIDRWMQSFTPSECVINRRDPRARDFVGRASPSTLDEWAFAHAHAQKQLSSLLK